MSTTTSTILLAEEHDATRAFLADNLIADGYRVLVAPDRAKALALLSDRASGPDPGRRQRRHARARRRDPLRRRARRSRRSGHPADRAEPRRRPAAADPGARARRRRRRHASRSPTRSCAPGSPRCCGDPSRGGGRHPACGPDRDRRPLARGARRRPAGRAVGARSTTCSSRSPASPPGCSPARS